MKANTAFMVKVNAFSGHKNIVKNRGDLEKMNANVSVQ